MKSKHPDFSITLISPLSPEKVFEAVRRVPEWWTGFFSEKIEGDTSEVGDEFSFHAGDGAHYSRQKLTEMIPGKKLVWRVTESNLSFTEKPDEWTDSRLIFEIGHSEHGTVLRFTHEGLNAEWECYNACAPAWTQYLENKLRPLIRGKMLPKNV